MIIDVTVKFDFIPTPEVNIYKKAKVHIILEDGTSFYISDDEVKQNIIYEIQEAIERYVYDDKAI